MPEYKQVRVKWVDSYGTNDWESKEHLEAISPAQCTTLGFLVEQTDHYIVLSPTVSEDQMLGRIAIPRPAVMQMVELEDGDPGTF